MWFEDMETVERKSLVVMFVASLMQNRPDAVEPNFDLAYKYAEEFSKRETEIKQKKLEREEIGKLLREARDLIRNYKEREQELTIKIRCSQDILKSQLFNNTGPVQAQIVELENSLQQITMRISEEEVKAQELQALLNA
jgi:chromosome segregation ATPase